MRRFLILLAIVPAAFAQTPTNIQRLSWAAPTQYTDGTTIPSTVAITYNVYAKLAGAAETKYRTAMSGTGLSAGPFPVGQRNCYSITVLVGGIESVRSPEACAEVQGLSAKPVTIVIIQ